MKDPIVVVGSGASGVHFAQTAVELGRRVTLIDVGFEKVEPVLPDATLTELRNGLDDPTGYFLGRDFESLILPSDESEYYGFPPSKSYVFRAIKDSRVRANRFAPLFSYAAGGLAQAWTGGSYPLNDAELEPFPFGWDEIRPHYETVARRAGIAGLDDDLSRFFPLHEGLQEPPDLDEHSRRLLATYEKKKARLNTRLNCYMGRARVATLRKAQGRRGACTYLGRCLWGCPQEALYTPSVTLDECRDTPLFDYRPGLVVDHFRYGDDDSVSTLVARRLDGRGNESVPVGTLVLAAGTLGSSRILLESLRRHGEERELSGLMDNRQILMPFVNLGLIGRAFEPASYQYHQLAICLEHGAPSEFLHGLVTTLKTAPVHPIVQSIPGGLRMALVAFRNIHAALGLLNINLPDSRREDNRVALDEPSANSGSALLIQYTPDEDEPERVGLARSRFRRFLAGLRCLAPPNMTRSRPMGASVHYAGTVPMSPNANDLTSDEWGRCRPFTNLVLADGSTFPQLPAKNLTFTLMANATRIASGLLEARDRSSEQP